MPILTEYAYTACMKRVLLMMLFPALASAIVLTPNVRPDGTFSECRLGEAVIPFTEGVWSGPSLLAQDTLKAALKRQPPEGITWKLEHRQVNDEIVLRASVTNTRQEAWSPLRFSLRVGLDCWMTHFPQWRTRFVPTLLRSEQTHFYGYAQSPDGLIIGVASPHPVASWTQLFNGGGHRIRTFDLDLLCSAPRPPHHPQGATASTLAPGETRVWEVRLAAFQDVGAWRAWARRVTEGPVPEVAQTTFFGPTGEVNFGAPVQVLREDGTPADAEAHAVWNLPAGHYRAVAANGKTATFSLFAPRSWETYLRWGRKEALRVQPTVSHHAECVYPFFSYFLARKHCPDAAQDAKAEAIFQDLFPKHYDREKGRLRTTFRIQDTAIWASILADRYAITHNEDDLLQASRLCDYLLTTQLADGAYYATHGKTRTHYTSVIYLAKSILEVMDEERTLAASKPEWAARYARHSASVRRAIENLADHLDDIQTEGEQTFEDGMISCSILQLALYALKTPDAAFAQKCTAAAETLWNLHRCLTMSESPDARVTGATIRYWETQYTVCLMANCLNSPCGWTAWKLYANHYLYLLTGKEIYLTQYFNGLGACLQLFDHTNGRLRWGFTPTPAFYARYAAKAPDGHPKEFVWKEGWFGEQYIEQISDWNRTDPIWRKKWGIDNFVHEIVKCMEEGAYGTGYLHQREDGSLLAYGGIAETLPGGALSLRAENTVRLVVRLAKPSTVMFQGKATALPAGLHILGEPFPDLAPL